MVTIHADPRRTIGSKNNLSQYRKPSSLFIVILAILSILPFTALGGGGGAAVTIPLSFSFIISIGGPSIYQAFIAGGNGLPVFTETNFSFLVNNDILGSPSCINGCSNTLNPGSYNLTNTIVDAVPNLLITGSPAAKIIPQNTVFPEPFGVNCVSGAGVRPVFCIKASNVVLQGFTIDDANRMFVAGVTGDGIFASSTSQNVLIQSMTIQNASSNGISLANTNTIVTTSTIIGPLPLPKTGGNFGILLGGTASRIRIFLNTISGFNGSDTSGIQMSNLASYISVSSNELFKNSFGISTTCGKFLTLEANNIHNNYAGGILLTTIGIGSCTAGPVSISGGTITDNAQEPNNDAQCNTLHCSGIILRAAKCCWDTVSITGVTIKDTQVTPTQTYDIHVFGTSTCAGVQCYSNVTITGNSLGRTSSGTTINVQIAPSKSWIISDNPGYNPQPVRGPLTAGATPFTYTNLDGYKEQIELITIGDMTAFTCRGIANIIQVDAISPILNTLDTCVFTYVAVAPTYDVLPT